MKEERKDRCDKEVGRRERSCKGTLKLPIVAKAVLLVLMAIAVTSLTLAPAAAQEADVTVSVNAPEYVEGNTFVATIAVDSVTDFNSAQFDLSFNPDVVKVSNVKEGEINGENIPIVMWVLNNDKDTVRVLASLTIGESESGSGYLAEVEFEVKGEEGEKSELNLSNGELVNETGKIMLSNWHGAEVTIGVTPTPTPEEEEDEEETTPTPTQEPEVTPTLTPEANITEPIVTTPTPTLAHGVTPLQEATPAVKTTPKPTAPPTTEEKLTPTPTPKPAAPGFEAMFAIAVMLAVAYVFKKVGR
ncbi:MAG: cohesin domain-containing protein [Halobacteriota archaeon]